MNDTQGLNRDLRIRVTEEKRRKVEELAHELSEPGNRVTVSDILRQALEEYLEQSDDERDMPR